MYLDNVIKSAQTANMPEVTYSEILNDQLKMVEVEGAGELALLKAEAEAHILGSEAPSDWWAKIKVVARKIFEMLKNLITKVFAFIKTVPTKIGSLINRILTKWEKLGMKSKMDRVLKKTSVSVRFSVVQDLVDREFPAMYVQGSSLPPAWGNGSQIVQAYTALNNAITDALNKIEKLEPENDNYEEKKQDIMNSVIAAEEAVADAKRDVKQHDGIKVFKGVAPDKTKATEANNKAIAQKIMDIIVPCWQVLKNKNLEKAAEKVANKYDATTRQHAAKYRSAMASYERAVKDEDEKKVRANLTAAKAYRQTISYVASAVSSETAMYYSTALTVAKIVNAGLACFKGGNTSATKEYINK